MSGGHRVLPWVALVASFFPFLAWAECVKTVRWYDDAPYAFKGADGQPAGIAVDLAAAALKTLHCQTSFVEMPWARALLELQAGRLDLLPGA